MIPLEIEGHPFFVSATADGHVVMIGDSFGHGFAASHPSGVTLGAVDPEADRLKEGLLAVQRCLVRANIKILEVVVLTNFGEVDGYFVVTDGDAMGALRKESSVAALGDGPAS